MAVQVAVVDPLPLFRDGVVAALTAVGHPVETPPDVVSWARQAREAIVLLTLLAESDWAALAKLAEVAPTNALVALLAEDSPAAGVRAARSGARSVLSRQVSAEVLQRTVAATIDGQAVLPAAVAAVLVAGAVKDARAGEPPAERLSWLRALAAGCTVAQLASQVGYSERAMFRLLRVLYRDMGVGSRVEALMRAQELGWLQLPTSPAAPATRLRRPEKYGR
jgi:DNA-binding NarL/FixJ family response regulator